MNAARRGSLLAALLLALACAGPARAADPVLDAEAPRTSGSADVPAWWARAGWPSWIPGAEEGGGFPWVYAGHAIGGWSLDEPLRASLRTPWPGTSGALAPLAWTTGLSVRWLGDAAWSGPGAGLVRLVDSIGAAPERARTRSSLFSFARGSSAEERNALRLVQHDSLRVFAGEAAEWTRGGTGSWQKAGAHLYGVGFSSPWRAGRLEGAFGQRGSAGAVTSGEEESVTGLGGFARLLAPLAGGEATFELGRDLDHRDSQGGVLLPGHRDAQRSRVETSWSRPQAGGTSAVRARFARSEVVNSVPGAVRTEWSDDQLWLAVRHRRAWAGGALEAALGGGSSSASGTLGPAPTLAWDGGLGGATLRVSAGRSVTPVWSDLAAGVEPFVQSAWSAGADAGFGAYGRRFTLGARVGTTRDRAIVARLPVAAWWLRSGVRRDGDPWTFALGTAGLSWSGAPGAVGLSGWALARRESDAQPAVDPALGATLGAEAHRRIFEGDLDVRLRGEAAYVGERRSEALVPRTLPGFATFGAAMVLTLADVTVVIDARRLEDTRRPEPWVDPRTGLEAPGPGREFRVALSWRLFD